MAVATDDAADIFPINFVVDHGTVVFRTAAGTKLLAALGNRAVALEVDGFDAGARTAWSVVPGDASSRASCRCRSPTGPTCEDRSPVRTVIGSRTYRMCPSAGFPRAGGAVARRSAPWRTAWVQLRMPSLARTPET